MKAVEDAIAGYEQIVSHAHELYNTTEHHAMGDAALVAAIGELEGVMAQLKADHNQPSYPDGCGDQAQRQIDAARNNAVHEVRLALNLMKVRGAKEFVIFADAREE